MTATEDCAALAPLYARRLLGTLEEDELDQVEGHLADCPTCPQAREDMQTALDTLNVPPRPAPAGVWERLDAELSAAPPQEAPAVPVRVALTCTYCHARLMAAAAAYCATCLAPHHPECFEEHGRCCAPGCDSTLLVSANPVARPTPRRRWRNRSWIGFAAVAAAAAWGFNELIDRRQVVPADISTVPTMSSKPSDAGPTYQGKSPEEWIKDLDDYDAGFRDRAAAALGEMGEQALPAVERALARTEPHVREGALRCIQSMRDAGNLSSERANLLACESLRDAHPKVRETARSILDYQTDPAVTKRLVELLGDARPSVVSAALLALSAMDGDLGTPALSAVSEHLQDADPVVREAAAYTIRTKVLELEGPPPPALALALTRALDGHPKVTPQVQAALELTCSSYESPPASLEPALLEAAKSEHSNVRVAALAVLATIPGDSAAAAIWGGLQDPDEQVRRESAWAIAQSKRTDVLEHVPTTLAALKMSKNEVTRAALRTALLVPAGRVRSGLQQLEPKSAKAVVAALLGGLKDPSFELQCACAKLLRELSRNSPSIVDREELAVAFLEILPASRATLRKEALTSLRYLEPYVLADTASVFSALSTWKMGKESQTLLRLFQQQDALSALKAVSPERARESIRAADRALRSSDFAQVRREAARILGSASSLRDGLLDGQPDTVVDRVRAAQTLALGLSDRHDSVRETCAWGLSRVGPASLNHVSEILDAMRHAGETKRLLSIALGARGDSQDLRLAATLGRMGPKGADVLRDLAAGLAHESGNARTEAAKALVRAARRIEGPRPDVTIVIPQLIASIEREKKDGRVAAEMVAALGECAPEEHPQAVTRLLLTFESSQGYGNDWSNARTACVRALTRIGGGPHYTRVRDALVLALLSDTDVSVRRAIAYSLGPFVSRRAPPEDPSSLSALLETLNNDVDKSARSYGAKSLGIFAKALVTPGWWRSQEQSRVVQSIETALTNAALRDGEGTVRKDADDALRRIRRKRAEIQAAEVKADAKADGKTDGEAKPAQAEAKPPGGND